MSIYPTVNFSCQPRIEHAPVARGFVTRKWADTLWHETLIQLPMDLLLHSTESIRHYTQWDDGIFHEFYGTVAAKKPVYVAACEFDPAVTAKCKSPAVIHLFDLTIKSVEQAGEKIHCPVCQSLTDHLATHFVELHVCRDNHCQHVFVVNTEPMATI